MMLDGERFLPRFHPPVTASHGRFIATNSSSADQTALLV
jgi:hypothetical protein